MFIGKCDLVICKKLKKKTRIRETLNLSTDADSRNDTILEKLQFFLFILRGCVIFLILLIL